MKKVLILTGSPKAASKKSSSFLMAEAMKSGMPSCDLKRIIEYKPQDLVAMAEEYDTILLLTPNYIHSLPAHVLQFLYAIPQKERTQKMGVLVQSGFPNESESEIVGRFLDQYIPSTGYQYIGRATLGESASYGFMESVFNGKKEYFIELGKRFYEKDMLDVEYLKEVKLCGLTTIPPKMEKKLHVMGALGITKISWCLMLRQHKAYRKRYDKPFSV